MSGREIEFLGTLGTGGFGAVYLATVTEADLVRRVAIKVMRDAPGAADDITARQRDEARLLAMLNHHAIVRVEALFEMHGRPAVMMELVDGVDVAAILKTTGQPLPLGVATHVAATVASALDAAWNAVSPKTGVPLRVVHRDIKPPNVLITTSGGVKVLDFGIARADFDREGVTLSHAFGTPRYMAPEHFSGGDIGPAYDVYALGVTLYEMSSGATWDRPPLLPCAFQGMLDERLALAPESLRTLLAELLALEPADRPTAAEAQERLEAIPEAGERISSFARRVVAPLAQKRRPDTSMGVPSKYLLDASLAAPDDLSLATPVVPTITASVPISGPSAVGSRTLPFAAAVALGLATVLGLGVAGGGLWWGIGRPSPATPETAAGISTPDALTPANLDNSPTPPPLPVTDASAGGSAPPTAASAPLSPTPSPNPSHSPIKTLDPNAGLREALVRESAIVAAPSTLPVTAPAPANTAPAELNGPRPTPESAATEAAKAPVLRRLSLVGDRRDVSVAVDGTVVGQTPVGAELSIGHHRVEFRYAEGVVRADFDLTTNSATTYKCSAKEAKCYWKAQ